jgi:hypothetical protein
LVNFSVQPLTKKITQNYYKENNIEINWNIRNHVYLENTIIAEKENKIYEISRKRTHILDMVVHACNPTYSGGRDQ